MTIPHVNTRWGRSDAEPHGSSFELWWDAGVHKVLVPCTQRTRERQKRQRERERNKRQAGLQTSQPPLTRVSLTFLSRGCWLSKQRSLGLQLCWRSRSSSNTSGCSSPHHRSRAPARYLNTPPHVHTGGVGDSYLGKEEALCLPGIQAATHREQYSVWIWTGLKLNNPA